jgi:hypothetical protein
MAKGFPTFLAGNHSLILRAICFPLLTDGMAYHYTIDLNCGGKFIPTNDTIVASLFPLSIGWFSAISYVHILSLILCHLSHCSNCLNNMKIKTIEKMVHIPKLCKEHLMPLPALCTKKMHRKKLCHFSNIYQGCSNSYISFFIDK